MQIRVSQLSCVHTTRVVAFTIAYLLVAIAPDVQAAQPADDWQFDLIHTRNGKVHQGLLVAETPEFVKFWRIIRSPGHPTRRMFWSYESADITRIERLSADQRRLLQERIQALEP